jgi:hypothetical protein
MNRGTKQTQPKGAKPIGGNAARNITAEAKIAATNQNHVVRCCLLCRLMSPLDEFYLPLGVSPGPA